MNYKGNAMDYKHKDYPKPTSSSVSKIMKSIKPRDTKPEVQIRSGLHALGYRYRKDLLIKIRDQKCRPDIVFTKQKLAIFIDGCFWHNCPEHGKIPKSNVHYWKPKLMRNMERDKKNNLTLLKGGWNVLRIWEHTPLEDAIQEIADAFRN